MNTRARLGILVVAAANVHADCGSVCTPATQPVPMTAAQANRIDPSVTTGFAASTTYVFGDCRPVAATGVTTAVCEGDDDSICARERRPLRVFVLPVNQSVPIDEACGDGASVDELASRAVIDAKASEKGELVVALAAGHYLVFTTVDERCGVCGLSGDDGCRIEVVDGRITARDLVVDASTH